VTRPAGFAERSDIAGPRPPESAITHDWQRMDFAHHHTRPRGRFAPSPTGRVHVGNARTALVTWLSIRSRGGTLVWRLEDIDRPRVVAGLAEEAERDLSWLGLDWDEGPDRGGAYGPYRQSERGALYEEALRALYGRSRLFPCSLSRRDLSDVGSAPHGPVAAALVYPRDLRPERLEPGWYEGLGAGGDAAAIRFMVSDDVVRFHDRVFGHVAEALESSVGDFVIKRRDGLFAYQLVVAVDDVAMEIDEVVRGSDLLASTARQIDLIRALDGAIPTYAHVPLVRNARGEKLSKRDRALAVGSLRDAGIGADQLVGYLAWTLGLIDRPRVCTPSELIDGFAFEPIGRRDLILPEDLTERLRAIE